MSWIDRGLPGVGENLTNYLPAPVSKHVAGIKPPAIRFYPGHALWYAIMLAWLSPVITSSMKERIADRKASLDQSSGQTFKYEKGEIGEAPELTVGHDEILRTAQVNRFFESRVEPWIPARLGPKKHCDERARATTARITLE